MMKCYCFGWFSILVMAWCLSGMPVHAQPQSADSDADYLGAVVPRPEPHGTQVCASGCALSRHPTPRLHRQKFDQLMADYAGQPMSEDSPALEELLFYGPQTKNYLEGLGTSPLDPSHLALLTRELQRDQVVIEFRIIDDSGQVRVSLPPTTVSLDKRYVFDPLNTHDFQPPEASGTVKRVGLNHLWQRI